ncbi:MAG: hypothetical protein KC996_01560, partial [Phycisphaerales bacterium]|nr:hypothetical protein [Phycisphaerales bacterium]
MSMRAWKFVGVVLAMVLGGTAHAKPEMVRPESLPQGFVLVVDDLPREADKENPIYLASSINGWNPSDSEMKLSGRSDTRWQIVIDRDLQGVGMQFKFTMGGWDREELDGDGNAIDNRSLPLIDKSVLAPGEKPVIELKVLEWRVPVSLAEQVRQSGMYRKLEVTGDVRRIEVRGGSGGAESMTRDLLVWLPPGYDAPQNKDKHYPVLYMCDGQNLFEQLAGVPGEWHADETATGLIERGKIEPIIIVGMPNSGAYRIREYLPFDSLKGVEPAGAEFVDWMLREVKPRVDRAFRTAQGAQDTIIGGASLGGAVALYASTTHPDVFGGALIESLPLLTDDGKAVRGYLSGVRHWPGRVFIGMGGREVSADNSDADRNAAYRDWAKEIDRVFRDAGLANADRMLVIEPEAHHNEPA